MPTTPGGRWSPGDTDDWDLTTDLAAMQVSNETAAANDIQLASNYRVLTNAQRLALPAAQLREGLRVWTSDTRLNHLYTNGAWISETPWTNLSLTSGFTNSSTPLQYKRTLNRVALRGAVYRSTVPSTFTLLATLPSGIPTPISQVRQPGRHDLGQQVAILASGEIQLTASTSVTSGAGYPMDGIGYDY